MNIHAVNPKPAKPSELSVPCNALIHGISSPGVGQIDLIPYKKASTIPPAKHIALIAKSVFPCHFSGKKTSWPCKMAVRTPAVAIQLAANISSHGSA